MLHQSAIKFACSSLLGLLLLGPQSGCGGRSPDAKQFDDGAATKTIPTGAEAAKDHATHPKPGTEEPVQNGKYMREWVSNLASPDSDIRFDAAANLGNIDGRARSAMPDLVRVLREDKDRRVRSAAAFALYKISADLRRHGGVHATEILDGVTAALNDPDPLTRMNAALALGTLESEARAALPALEKAIQKKENKVKVLTFTLSIREQMIANIGSMGADGKESLPLLEEMLRDDEETTRAMCARTLGKLGPAAKHAMPLLLNTIRDPAETEFVVDSAKEAIKLIDPDEANKPGEN
jgi:HEAT repeat protein